MRKFSFKSDIASFPSDISSLKKFEKFLERLKNKYKISDEDFYRIFLASSEAFINAIVHGNKLNSSKRVIVKFRSFKKSFEIEIQDEGEGFKANFVLDPTSEENLLKESGRGIYIMKSFSDAVKFYKTKRGFKVKIKIKKRSGVP
ncbi:MAG: ATP-binding protein [Candidatus Kryptonium sp.]